MKTIKIKNVSQWTTEIHRPTYVEFPPGQVIEIDYTLGMNLARQPEYSIVPDENETEKEITKKKKVK
jgi:hypothetical protein